MPDLYCQGLAGPWYARRERGSVKARVQCIQWFGDADEGVSPNETEVEREDSGLQE